MGNELKKPKPHDEIERVLVEQSRAHQQEVSATQVLRYVTEHPDEVAAMVEGYINDLQGFINVLGHSSEGEVQKVAVRQMILGSAVSQRGEVPLNPEGILTALYSRILDAISKKS